MLVFDIETLDTESTAVVLSASIVYFEENDTWESLLDKALFVKFNAKEQIDKYKRTVSKSTLKWWNEQSDTAKNVSFLPSNKDVGAEEGIDLIKRYLANDPANTKIIWTRGSLDSMVFESLTNAVGTLPLVKYNQYRGIRTGIDILASNSSKGYCDVNLPGFDVNKVVKHDPVHDICYDALMLLYPV